MFFEARGRILEKMREELFRIDLKREESGLLKHEIFGGKERYFEGVLGVMPRAL